MSPSTPRHTVLQSLFLHFLPGLATTIAFFILHALLKNSAFPPLMAFLLAVCFVDLPIQVGILYGQGRKINGRFSLQGVLAYQEKLPRKKFALVFIAAFAVLYLLIMLATPLNIWLTEHVFAWMPAWMMLDEQSQYLVYTKNTLIIVFTMQLVLTGLVLPWVEELYFRGFLLPRLPEMGNWTPIVGGVFFALYHLWQPQGFLTVFLLGAALAFLTRWQRDLRLPISLHVIANTISRLAFLAAAIQLP